MTPLEINKKIAELKGYTVEKNLDNTVKIGRNDGADSLFYNWAENIEEAWELFKEFPEAGIESGIEKIFKGNFCLYVRIGQENKNKNKMNYAMSCKPNEVAITICKIWIVWKEEISHKLKKEIEEK